MITAVSHGDDGIELITLGITRENINRLIDGKPISVNARSHPGFPRYISIMIMFGETERDIVETLKPFMTKKTKTIAVPKDEGSKQ